MKTDNDKISLRQSNIMVILYFFCSSIITMPIFCVFGAGQAGGFAVIISSVFMLIPLFLIYLTLKNDKSKSFYELCDKKVGTKITNIFYIVFTIKFILLSVLILKIFTLTIKKFLLPQTPIFLTAFLMLMLCGYLAGKGIEVRGRMGETVIFLIGIPFFIVFFVACFSVDINNISDIFEVSAKEIVKTGFWSHIAFCSFDFLLLHFYYCSERKKALEKMFINSISTIFVTAIAIFITSACFGTYIMSRQYAPIPEIMNIIKLPPTIIERYDLLNMFFWIILLFWLLSTTFFWGSISLKDIFKKSTHKFFIVILFFIIYAFSFITANISLIYGLIGILNIISNIFFYIITIMLFIAKGVMKNEK